MTHPSPPMSLLAELTYLCPLRCPYCSNPTQLTKRNEELSTDQWKDILTQAADLGILQVHFSGGEPTIRSDLVELVKIAAHLNLYTNLITSGLLLTPDLLEKLAENGLDHIQLSFQDTLPEAADLLSGMRAVQPRKLQAAEDIKKAGFPLTLNFVVHRGNIERIEDMLALGYALGARRVEIAHIQYHGWALINRPALLPSLEQVQKAEALIAHMHKFYKNRMVIDHVTPDYYTDIPKPCMGGWGQRFLNVTPRGNVLPCHAAESIPNITVPSIKHASLAEIWNHSSLFSLFRGTEWMKEPCQSCDRKTIDWGGCRCQALALTGDAAHTDPVCHLSPHHERILAITQKEGQQAHSPSAQSFTYRTASFNSQS
ncbi:pyrroloquinoline quinone biosynthesis protein PqqE [Entomobacter blattae]|uniref:PqqA peptide cyclase n=1 Tax=Entomobacter blattae TaxID=2762277 RepID=A0A7H1NPR8_9PROT|nr:pyrroloquinoline quinone biosynthesis protein PqqE [Entomobacter blattae]QNT77778.1 Putative mycofactocin radical SAM maturase MftC [Entomobacter blattae]